jgi:hypothetical protein
MVQLRKHKGVPFFDPPRTSTRQKFIVAANPCRYKQDFYHIIWTITAALGEFL